MLVFGGVHWSYNPFTNHLLTSWDIQATTKNELDRHLAKMTIL